MPAEAKVLIVLLRKNMCLGAAQTECFSSLCHFLLTQMYRGVHIHSGYFLTCEWSPTISLNHRNRYLTLFFNLSKWQRVHIVAMGINEKTTNQPHKEHTVGCHQFLLLFGKEFLKALQQPQGDLAKNKEALVMMSMIALINQQLRIELCMHISLNESFQYEIGLRVISTMWIYKLRSCVNNWMQEGDQRNCGLNQHLPRGQRTILNIVNRIALPNPPLQTLIT